MDGRHVLFDGEGSRRTVMELAHEAADHAKSVHVVWNSSRTLSPGWPQSMAFDNLACAVDTV